MSTDAQVEAAADPEPDFIVVRLARAIPSGNDLRRVAQQFGFRQLADFLEEHREIRTARVVRSVLPRVILRLEERARHSDFPPLHSLTSFWHLDCRATEDPIESLVEILNGFPEVTLAYRELRVSDPTTVPNPIANPRYASQGYLSRGRPHGINAVQGWLLSNGGGIGFSDVERSWCGGHEDLFPDPNPASRTCKNIVGATVIAGANEPACHSQGMHGAAVLGIVVGKNNGLGGVGIAPGAGPVRLASRFVHTPGAPNPCTGTLFNVVDAIAKAIEKSARGDVLLLEVQRDEPIGAGAYRWVPTEYLSGDFTAIRLASALGLIVVESAGNGGFNASGDTPGYDLGTLPTALTAATASSGAIIVGSSDGVESTTVPGTQDRRQTSNFGSRVDCYAWGTGVPTAGDETLGSAGAPTTWYTNSFGGTSAAAAIIAGAALVVQGAYKDTTPVGRRLTPAAMRALLRNPLYGTPCSKPGSENVGSMPDLGLVLQQIGSLPDLYIRDNPTDDGSIPTAGAISISPDVVVSPTNVPAATAFAAGATDVKVGQTNFVYVRVSNRNAQPAPSAKVFVYWSEVLTLVTPDKWKQVNTSLNPATVNVPASAALVPATTITWSTNLPPATGHYCFVASVTHPADPEPLSFPFGPGSFTWDEFFQYIKLNNNVTWRNFDVVPVVVPGGGGGLGPPAPAPFGAAGAPDAERGFDLEVALDRRNVVRVEWEMPWALFRELDERNFADVHEGASRVTAVLRDRPRVRFRNVRLRKGRPYPCRFVIQGRSGLLARPASLAIRQFYAGTEVGRITWQLRGKRA
jgi:serine protease